MRGGQAVTVVKLGGEVVSSPQMAVIAKGLLALSAQAAIAVVHGGGPQLSALQERLTIPVRQIAGRRYTDEATLEALKMAVVGRVNVDLCTALRAAGLRPVGLHGAVQAVRRKPRVYPGAGPDPVDLGLVGDVTRFDTELLELLWSGGRVPVLACLGVAEDAEGALYNINADTVASSLATKLAAQRLVLISDSPVLRDRSDPGSVIPRLTLEEARALISQGVAVRGMAAKLDEACAAVERGVGEVHVTADLAEQTTVIRRASSG